MKYILILLSGFIFSYAQNLELLDNSLPEVSFRGLSVVSDNLFWVSGSKGTVGKSEDAGKTFQWVNPAGYADRDFRDIYSFDENMAVIIGIDHPAVVLKTTDGGRNWKEVYRDESEGVFLDDIDISTKSENGIIIGDPVKEDYPYILYTNDQGDSWILLDIDQMKKESITPLAKGEAFFSASGSNVKLIDSNTYFLVSGGTESNLYLYSGDRVLKYNLNKTNSSTTGSNGMDFSKEYNFGVIIGGDFSEPENNAYTAYRFELEEGNIKIEPAQTMPDGYKSGVMILDNKKVLSCGTTGVEMSLDQGLNWTEKISGEKYHVCKKSENGKTVYLAGPGGKIAKLTLEK